MSPHTATGPGHSTAQVPWNPCSAASKAHKSQQSAPESPRRLREARNRKRISTTLTTKDLESQLALQLSKEWRQPWAGGRPDFHGNENSKFSKRQDEERTQSCRNEGGAWLIRSQTAPLRYGAWPGRRAGVTTLDRTARMSPFLSWVLPLLV